jgi:hypothetical protein
MQNAARESFGQLMADTRSTMGIADAMATILYECNAHGQEKC